MGTIKRSDALKEMEIKESPSGGAVYFSIQFYKQNGELVMLRRAIATGLRMNMSANRVRGVRPVDASGNAIGHIYPVSIDNLRVFNNQKVIL